MIQAINTSRPPRSRVLSPVALFIGTALWSACSTIDGKIALTDSDNDGVPDTRDCAPDDPDIRPGIDEICDGEDQDCDGEIDENAIDAEPEICDGIDNDCDGEIDEDLAVTLYEDRDGDGYGDPGSAVALCDPDAGLVDNGDDCNDDDETIYPGADELCDEVDNDCDTLIDEDLTSTFFADTDGDGFGDPANTAELCAPSSGWLTDSDDCDDGDGSIYPGAPESCNDGIDQDCDGDDTFCLIYGDLLLDPDADITISNMGSSPTTGDRVGFTDDIDGDGRSEVWVTSPSWDDGTPGGINAGAASIANLDPTFRQGLIDLSQSAASGWTVTHIEGVGKDQYNATMVESVGDIDGDGLGDMLLGSESYTRYEPGGGVAQLVLGSSLAAGDLRVTDADIIFRSLTRNSLIGTSVTGAGDLNGDGFDDLIIGAEGKVDVGSNRPGGVMVWLGCDTGVGYCFDSDGDGTVETEASWGDVVYVTDGDGSLFGDAGSADYVGSAVVSNFDFNGDGATDMFVGARGAQSGGGEIYLVLDFPFSSESAWSQASLILEGSNTDAIGSVLEAPGDLDGDGYDDLVMGVPLADSNTGRVYILTGRGDVELSSMPRQMPVEDADFTLLGEAVGEQFGASISAGGDVDGDGIAELLVGAPIAEPGSVSRSGEVRILRGPPAADMADDPLARLSGTSEDGRVGSSVASAVDLDGDGWAEVIVGASGFGGTGAAFVLYGGYHP